MRIGRIFRPVTLAWTFLLIVATGRCAWGQYSVTVLYPLDGPPGVGGYEFINGGDDAGDIVGSIGQTAFYWSIGSPPMTISNLVGHSVAGNQIVGSSGGHAYVQIGPSGPGTDLNPGGMGSSKAFSTDGTQQVGAAAAGLSVNIVPVAEAGEEAYLWNGSASSAVNLNPAGFSSVALGTDGINQVGQGYGPATGGAPHALLWNASSSYIDLNPSGFSGSVACAVDGNEEVGYGNLTSDTFDDHALLWTGSAGSYTDLNPSAISISEALATNGNEQVGIGFLSSNGGEVGLLWDGTAASAIDLSSFLPASDNLGGAVPLGIDAAGDVFGWAADTSANYFAIEWTPVPEPNLSGAMALAAITFIGGRRTFRHSAA